MLGRFTYALAACMLALLPVSPASAEPRAATAIGNAEGAHSPGSRDARSTANHLAQAPTAATADDRAVDLAFWNAAQAANECAAMRAYLNRFPNGIFVELAQLAERRLCAAAAAPAAAPAPAAADAPPVEALRPAAAGGELAKPHPTPSPAVAAPAPPAAPALSTLAPPVTERAGSAMPPSLATPAALPNVTPAETGQATSAAPRTAAVPAPTPAGDPPHATPDVELVRTIQLELVRVGCGELEPNGRWSPETQEAVMRFNEHARWRFDPRVPSPALIAALRRSDPHACPLECDQGFEAQGNRCVAVAPEPPAPEQKAARPPEKKRNVREKPRAKKQEKTRTEREKPRAAAPERRSERRSERRRSAPEAAPRAERAAPAAAASATRGGLRCRFVPRATGGGFNGDTIEVCN